MYLNIECICSKYWVSNPLRGTCAVADVRHQGKRGGNGGFSSHAARRQTHFSFFTPLFISVGGRGRRHMLSLCAPRGPPPKTGVTWCSNASDDTCLAGNKSPVPEERQMSAKSRNFIPHRAPIPISESQSESLHGPSVLSCMRNLSDRCPYTPIERYQCPKRTKIELINTIVSNEAQKRWETCSETLSHAFCSPPDCTQAWAGDFYQGNACSSSLARLILFVKARGCLATCTYTCAQTQTKINASGTACCQSISACKIDR